MKRVKAKPRMHTQAQDAKGAVQKLNREKFDEILCRCEEMGTTKDVGDKPTSTEREPDMLFRRKES